MKKNENGFSAVELVMVLFIIGLIGIVGWFVLNKQRSSKADDTQQVAKQTQPTTTTKESTAAASPSDSWLKYTSQNNKYSMAIPDGWHLLSTKGQDDLYAFAAKDITFTTGTPGQVKIIESGGDGMVFWLVYNYKNNKNFDLSYQLSKSEKTKTYVSSNGVNVVKYTRTQTAEPEGADIAKGTVEYIYDLATDKGNAVIIYDVRVGDENQTQKLEDAITTLKFL